MVKLGNFGQQGKFGHTFVYSGNPDEMAPYEPSQQDFHCLLLKLIYFFISIIKI